MIIYMNSKALNKKIKVDIESKIITVQDKKVSGKKGYVTYSLEEVQIINDTVGEITEFIHQVKNSFDGTIIGDNN